MQAPEGTEENVLILAPLGRDAELTAAVLNQAGIHSEICATLEELVDKLAQARGAIVLAAEALSSPAMPRLAAALATQPSWSDLPVVLLTPSAIETPIDRRAIELLGPYANVTLLERPVRVLTLTSTLQVALRARRRQYEVRNLFQQREEMLASIRDAFATLDREWRYTYVNEHTCQLSGMSAGAMLGKTIWELLPDILGTEMEANLRKAMRERATMNFEWCSERWEHRWFSVRLYPSETGLSLFIVEITERKRIEIEAVEANRAKDRFLAALSHELRTPLTPVLMTVAALQQEPTLPEPFRDDLEMIHRNVELEARLIDDLLDLTRITRGKLTLYRQTVDVHQLLHHALETCCNYEVAQKELDVRFLPNAPEHHVEGDPARLQQILWNLINNAVKFTGPGGRIELSTSNLPSDRIQIVIRDTGIGIEPDLLPRLFDAFEQGTAAVTRRFGGLGLGLAISKALADLHGGSLRATSEGTGRGATFILEVKTTKAPHEADSGPKPPLSAAIRPRRVLLAEDHEPTRHVLTRLLTRAGHHVHAAATMRAALELAARNEFDVLISDLGLPDGSGNELMQTVHSQYGLSGIALSGYGMEDDVRGSLDAGFTVHLTKPVDWRRLEVALAEIDACQAVPETPHAGYS